MHNFDDSLGYYTLRGQERDVFEGLEAERHERGESIGVSGGDAGEGRLDSQSERGEVRMVLAVYALAFHEAP